MTHPTPPMDCRFRVVGAMSSPDMNHVELTLPEEWLAESWNKQADDFNQWDSLSLGKQLQWAQVQAVEADRARAALQAEADDCPGCEGTPAHGNSTCAVCGHPSAPPATETPARLRQCPTHGQQPPNAWGCPECVREMRLALGVRET